MTERSLAVAICTYRREDLLRALLRRVAELATSELADWSVSIVVVDDSPDGSARPVVEAAIADGRLPIEYVVTASGDISIARNRAIETAAGRGALVVCIDDDCSPQDGWLREHVRIAELTGADLVVGHREFVAPPGAPRWLSEGPFLEENERYADASVPRSGNTANLAIRAAWLERSGVRFRHDLGKLGGEDMVFFADARAAGAEIRFAAGSVVSEPHAGARTSFRYQLWRQCWLGNNEAQIDRRTRDAGAARLLLRGSKRVLTGLVRPLVRAARRQPPQWHWSLATAGRGAGLVLGVVGVRLRHRS